MIGDNIKRIREQHNLTQQQLANLLNVSDKTISSWEINRTEPKYEILDKLSAVFNVPKIEIIGGILQNVEETEIIEKYRLLDEYGKKAVKRTLDGEYERVKGI